jgi:hypothetical protein
LPVNLLWLYPVFDQRTERCQPFLRALRRNVGQVASQRADGGSLSRSLLANLEGYAKTFGFFSLWAHSIDPVKSINRVGCQWILVTMREWMILHIQNRFPKIFIRNVFYRYFAQYNYFDHLNTSNFIISSRRRNRRRCQYEIIQKLLSRRQIRKRLIKKTSTAAVLAAQ